MAIGGKGQGVPVDPSGRGLALLWTCKIYRSTQTQCRESFDPPPFTVHIFLCNVLIELNILRGMVSLK